MGKKILIKLFIFLFGLFILYQWITNILIQKEYPFFYRNVNILVSPYLFSNKQDGFYSEKKNSLDVVFLGSSQIHCNINPNLIWSQYGITSYDFSADQQELGTTYYYLLEMFKYQSPKVVVIDVHDDGSQISIANNQAHYSFDFMKNDVYKYMAIWNRTHEDRLEMYIPLIVYHERWKVLNKNDFLYKPYYHNLLKGSFIYMKTYECNPFVIPNDISDYALSERTLFWIENILKECRKHNCECLFIHTPIASNYDEELFSYLYALKTYFSENGINYLLMNEMIDEIGIDFKTDYADRMMHLNWNGMKKISAFLGKYLQETYGIENKKGLSEYAQWDKDYAEMMYYVNNFDDLYTKYEEGVKIK